jgi:capsular polysaccharide biosynthesis protein/Mrp family chromosome partitioning ATPase
VELSGYLTVVRRWWWTLLVAAWVAALSGYLVASRITPTYEAQVQMLVGPINTDTDTLKASGQLVQTYAQLAVGPKVLQPTAAKVSGVDPVILASSVRATASDVTRVLQIRVQDADPARAATIANTMADELIQITTGATTRPEGQLEVIAPAIPPVVPIAPQVSLIVLLAAAAGLLGGLILVTMVEYATDSVHDRSDLTRLVPASILSTVSFDQRSPGRDSMAVEQADAPDSQNAIAFRQLAAKIAFATNDAPTRSTLITSMREGDSAVVAMNVGAAMAASGHRVIVVDGSSDGDLTAVLEMSKRQGLADVIGARGIAARTALAGGPAGVRVMPSGAEGDSELVPVERLRSVLDALLHEADLVVIDGGTVQRSASVLTWARAAEKTVLVVRRGSTRRDELRLAAESLRFVDAALGGTVFVQRPASRFRLRRRRRRISLAAMAVDYSDQNRSAAGQTPPPPVD